MDDIPVQVEYKNVRNINLRIRSDGTVHMSVPFQTSDAQIEAFARSHVTWIKRHTRQSTVPPTAEVPTSADLWGTVVPVRIEVGRRATAKARLEGNAIIISAKEGAPRDNVVAAIRAIYADQVREALPSVVARCEKRMGVSASSWRIRHMTSRWGSCNVKTRAITINSALAQFSPRCLEQVVTHELCHLFSAHHDDRFYHLMDTHFPSWREAREELKTKTVL